MSIRPYRRNSLGLIDNGFEDFYDMIDSFFNDGFTPQRAMEYASFKVDISEDDKSYTVEAELPGFSKDDIQVTLEDGKLTLLVEKQEDESKEEKNYIHKERKFSHMQRTMHFKNIDENGLTAKLDNGVLEINIPKKEIEDKKKRIEIE